MNQRLGTSIYRHLKALKEPAKSAAIALEVGGDHYSLDYGKPVNFMAMDRFLKGRGLPVVLWGASVGPFDKDAAFAARMFDHLRTLTAIFVRESDSFDYLRANGVSENVHLAADPAFVMKPVEPPAGRIGFSLPAGAVGINLSPMVAFYRGQHPADVDLREWLTFCVGLIQSVVTSSVRSCSFLTSARLIPVMTISPFCTHSARPWQTTCRCRCGCSRGD